MRKLLPLLLLFILSACQSESRSPKDSQNPWKSVELITKSGDSIETTLSVTPTEQTQGLSGVKPEDYSDHDGMLFFYTMDGERTFWMPDTYFDLDLFYLDKDMKVLDIVRKLQHYVGRTNPDLIPRARSVWARHVLEMKSSSPVAAKIQIGDSLQWKSMYSLKETEAAAAKLLNQ